MKPLIEVQNLTIRTRDKILVDNLDFHIEKGEMLALVGESGSGKSLTALSLLDLLPNGITKTGMITCQFGEHPAPFSRNMRGRNIGIVLQEPMTALNPLHTIGKQIKEAITVHQKMQKPALRARVEELLQQVGLEELSKRLDAYPHQLSGGQRQRVMIAMAIANKPDLLIADEPTTALDVNVQSQILKLLAHLQQESQMAILLITHDLSLVKKTAHRVMIMQHGKLVESGAVAELFAHPKQEYTKKLLASSPREHIKPSPKTSKMLLSCKGLALDIARSGSLLAWKKHTTPILEDIHLTLLQGTTLGIVGESGSGKTTLALALLRLIKSRGEIVFEDIRLDTLSASALRKQRRDMNIVFQDPFSSLNPRMTVGAIIREGLDVHERELSLQEKEQKVEAILEEVGLEASMQSRYPHEFSGGQRQRIGIARALILHPKLIILDEPTSALDISVQAQILDLLIRLQQKYGISYLFISHDLRTIRAMSHNIMVLQKGKVVETGEAESIFTHPQHEYTKMLIKNLA